MAFKDDLANDLQNIFFNTEEFAELVDYNGNSIKAIVDFSTDLNYATPNVYAIASVLIKKIDMPEPIIGDTVTIGGILWVVFQILQGSGDTWLVQVRKDERARL